MRQENQEWITLFHRLPADLHNTLVLGLHTGAEIVLQSFIKLDPDFMIIRGRVSGTQDSGRIIMVPYNQLTFVASTQLLKDTEVEAIFGKDATPMPLATARPTAEEPPSSDHAAEDEALMKKPEQPSKVALLAKLRDRLKGSK